MGEYTSIFIKSITFHKCTYLQIETLIEALDSRPKSIFIFLPRVQEFFIASERESWLKCKILKHLKLHSHYVCVNDFLKTL